MGRAQSRRDGHARRAAPGGRERRRDHLRGASDRRRQHTWPGNGAQVVLLEAGPDYGPFSPWRLATRPARREHHPLLPRLGLQQRGTLGDRVIAFEPRPRARRLHRPGGAIQIRGPPPRRDYIKLALGNRLGHGLDAGVLRGRRGTPRGVDHRRRRSGPVPARFPGGAPSTGLPRLSDDPRTWTTDVGATPRRSSIRDGVRWNAAFALPRSPCATWRTWRSAATRSSLAGPRPPAARPRVLVSTPSGRRTIVATGTVVLAASVLRHPAIPAALRRRAAGRAAPHRRGSYRLAPVGENLRPKAFIGIELAGSDALHDAMAEFGARRGTGPLTSR